MEILNHRAFYNMILSGAHQIINNKKQLNDINVFPVADGDTGTNLAYLMEMIMRETQWREPSSDMLERMKLACLRGSRGNSGMIFSQFIITMCNFLQQHHVLKDEQFLVMCEQSVETAYRSVAIPQEGTILTVMTAWVEEMRKQSWHSQGIQKLLRDSYSEVCTSLENTKFQIEVLRKHDVVDAGAKGFVHFLQGIIEAISYPQDEVAVGMEQQANVANQLSSVAQASNPMEDTHAFVNNQMPEYRYCSEFLFHVSTDLSTIKEQLGAFGDSLIIVGDHGQGKVHIHTNSPEQIAEVICMNGSITYQKVEDMQRQYESIYARNASIAIVVDSACDMPSEWLDKYQIHMLPLHLQLGDSTYLDKVTLGADTFYKKLEEVNEQPKSSQPSLDTITMLYEQLLVNYDHVISIQLSEKLSGTYQACCNAAKQVDPERIHVINSRTLSGAYGLLVHRAAEAVLSGQSIDEVIASIESWIPRTEILVSVPTLKFMIRGGRVSPLQGRIARLLNMKPIVSIDSEGKSLLYGKSLFKRSSIGKMFGLIQQLHRRNPIESYVILHAGAAEESMAYCEEEMEAITHMSPLYISSVAPVIGMNAGKGAISIAMVLEDNKDKLTK